MNNRIIKNSPIRLLLLAALFLFIFGCAGSGGDHYEISKIIRIKGSDTMLLLVRRWAEAFMQANPGISIYTEGGGSRTGIRALINGAVEIAAVSRSMQPEEIRELVEKRNSLGISVLCAKDALSIYLHPLNPVKNLTMEQVKNIFAGKISNWQDCGGENMPITVYGRNRNSGTHLFFTEHALLGEAYSDQMKSLPTTDAIVQAVASNPGAIGYGGMAYGANLHHAKINNIEPTPENVRNGKYAIARYLYLYTATNPRGTQKQFIDWVLSPEGQKIVGEVGYIPLFDR